MTAILAIDVQYADADRTAVAAGILFSQWEATKPTQIVTVPIKNVFDYEPGQFYLRELPCIQQVLAQVPKPDYIIVDGYVDVTPGHPGLGRHLFNALEGRTAIIGVAKTWFKDTHAIQILRGDSDKPLFITAAGMDPDVASLRVQRMAGPFRIPTLLKQVDQIARGR